MVEGATEEEGKDGEGGGGEELQKLISLLMRLSWGKQRASNEDEGPWELVVFVKEEVHKVPYDDRHDSSRDELAESEYVEGWRGIGGGIAGYLGVSHVAKDRTMD